MQFKHLQINSHINKSMPYKYMSVNDNGGLAGKGTCLMYII